MSTKLKLFRNLKHYLNDTATKRIFLSLIQSTTKYNCLTNLNFPKAEIITEYVGQVAERFLGNDSNLSTDELNSKQRGKW